MIIYAYTTKTFREKGWLKIGQTKDDECLTDWTKARERIRKQDNESCPEPLECEFAERVEGVSDKDIHAWLQKRRVHRPRSGKGSREWFECDVAMVKTAINALSGKGERSNSFPARREQSDAVRRTREYFESNEQPKKFLWNAKMRFGKTFSTYLLAKEMNAKRVLVLTYKPAAVSAWHEDLTTHTSFADFSFVDLGEEDRSTPFCFDNAGPTVVFASFQLLNKNADNPVFDNVFRTEWDLLVVDEVHYGAGSDLASETLSRLSCSVRLDLSGTPFRLLQSGEYVERQIFQWTYNDEQRARAAEIAAMGDEAARNDGQYFWLSPLRIYTFRPGDSIFSAAKAGVDETSTGFSANSFFKSEDGKEFVFANEVRQFLDELAGTDGKRVAGAKRLGNVFSEIQIPVPGKGDVWTALPCKDIPWLMSHTFWYLPSVNACHAMKSVMSAHRFFKHYEIVCAAGDNDGEGGDALGLVETAIATSLSKNEAKRGTITLSCGKLNTGVTVPEWSAVLMLTDTESSQDYFQTIFRAQSPWTWRDDDGGTKGKEHCFVFDFNPNRVLQHIYTEAAARAESNGGNARDEIEATLSILNVLCCEDGELARINENDVIDSVMSNGAMRSLLAKKFVSERMLGGNWTSSDAGLLDILSKIDEAEDAPTPDGKTTVSASDIPSDDSDNAKGNKEDHGNEAGAADKRDANASLKKRREKLKSLCGRIPFFIYLSAGKPASVADVASSKESALFELVSGITQSELRRLVDSKVLDERFINDAITVFHRYEGGDLLSFATRFSSEAEQASAQG